MALIYLLVCWLVCLCERARAIGDDYTEAVRQKYFRIRKAYARNGMFLGKLRKNR